MTHILLHLTFYNLPFLTGELRLPVASLAELPAQIVELMQSEGYADFRMHEHTQLWQEMDAKKPSKGYGKNEAGKHWFWYESWVDVVRQHCKKNYGETEQ